MTVAVMTGQLATCQGSGERSPYDAEGHLADAGDVAS
jgi:hypothetical protein